MSTASFAGVGIANAAANVQDWDRNRNMRELQRREAEARVTQLEQSIPIQAQQQQEELAQLKMQTKQLAQQQFKNETFNALRLYESDGDPRHLNGFLQQAKQSPVGGGLFKDIARVDRPTSSDSALFGQLGIRDTEGLLKDPNLARQYVVATFTNGERGLIDMEKLYAGTGFANQLAGEQADLLSKRALAISRLRQGESVERLSTMERFAKEMAKDLGISEWEAYQRLKQGATKSNGSELERLAGQIMEQNPGMDYLAAYEQAVSMRSTGSELERRARAEAESTGEPYAEVLKRLAAERDAPSSVKEANAANEAVTDLQKAFGGKYYETNFNEPANRRIAEPYIQTLEKTSGTKFSEEDKRQFRSVRQLMSLGQRAGEKLTPEETGIIDSTLKTLRSYISDTVTDGSKGAAAYESFRNVVRNALFGSALTSAEISAFNKAAGTLGQQQGPVLAKLAEQLRIVKSNLEGVAQLNNETLSHYYLGADREKLDDIIQAIDERVNTISRMSQTTVSDIPLVPAKPLTQPKTPEETKARLDAIFGKGGNQ